tara:strand:- start:80 stop:304 length:225 start_codon:yes stop_codon:yes gene_type:complete
MLKKGSLVKHKIVHRESSNKGYRYGIALQEVKDNPYLKDCWKVAWIPTDEHPVGSNGQMYVDHVKKQNLIVVSS